MTPGALQRLRAEVQSDRHAFDARCDELVGIDLAHASTAELAQAAVALHHAYGAVEAALVRIGACSERALRQDPTGISSSFT